MADQRSDSLLSLLSRNERNGRKNDLFQISTRGSTCRVCGGPGRCVNYGALTCQACRAFFRRHGSPSKIVPPCPWNGECEVNIHHQIRNPCVACRLARCLAVGMSATYMRKSERSLLSQEYSDVASKSTVSRSCLLLPTLDLLHNDRSNLTNAQWTLLSNIVHAYDVFSTVSYACSITEQLSRLSLNQNYDGSYALGLIQQTIQSMRSFLFSIPDFQILTTGEQSSLLERNWHSAAGLNFIFVLRDSALGDTPQFTSDGLVTYGQDVIDRALKIKEKLELDSTLIKIMVVVLVFSSSCLILKVPNNLQDDHLMLGTFRLLGSQNVFVDLLWNYMLYRYGYLETVLRFAHLIKQVLNTINHVARSYLDNENHRQFMDQIFAEDRLVLAASRNVHMPLWGNAQR